MESQLLRAGHVPSVDQLAEIIATRDESHADWLRRGQDVQVQVLGTATGHDASATLTASTEVVAVTARWSTWSDYAGRDLRGEATVIQVVSGGLDHGEGYAEYQQYVSRRALDEHAAALIASLAVEHAVPVLARGGEL